MGSLGKSVFPFFGLINIFLLLSIFNVPLLKFSQNENSNKRNVDPTIHSSLSWLLSRGLRQHIKGDCDVRDRMQAHSLSAVLLTL